MSTVDGNSHVIVVTHFYSSRESDACLWDRLSLPHSKMGNFLSNLLARLFADVPARVCMVGLDGAGKTTILYKLKFNEVVTTIPTIGFNVDTVNVNNLTMTVWDVGGQKKIR